MAVVGLVAGGWGCAAQPFRGPENGGPEWIEARSKHFRLLTSQGEGEAKEALEQLEVSQAIFEQVAFPSSENPPGISEVVILPAAEFDASALGFALESGQPLHLPVATLAGRLAKYPPKASQLNLLASYFGKTGEIDRAIGLAGRAVRLDSSCVACYITGSELLAAKGNLLAAVNARRAAIALAGERVESSEQQRLRQLEQLLAQQAAGVP